MDADEADTDALHVGGHRRFENVERAGRQHVVREPRILGAMRDADRGFVEDDVDAFHRVADDVRIADVAFDDRHLRPKPRAGSRF